MQDVMKSIEGDLSDIWDDMPDKNMTTEVMTLSQMADVKVNNRMLHLVIVNHLPNLLVPTISNQSKGNDVEGEAVRPQYQWRKDIFCLTSECYLYW